MGKLAVVVCRSLAPGAPMRRDYYETQCVDGMTVADVVRLTRRDLPDVDLLCYLNHRRAQLTDPVNAGDRLVYGPQIHGVEAIIYVALSFAASIGLSYLSSLLAPDPLEPEDESSPTHRWNGARTTYGDGYYTPVVVGDTLLGGHVISQNITPQNDGTVSTERMDLVLELGWGRFHSIAGITVDSDNLSIGGPGSSYPQGIRINGVTIDSTTGATVDGRASIRLGDVHQFPMTGAFSRPSAVVSSGFVLDDHNASTIVFVPSVLARRLRVQLDFPQGVYDQAGADKYPWEVTWRVEWRDRGSSSWVLDGNYTTGQIVDPNPFVRTHEFDVAPVNAGASAFDGYEVRVTRTSATGPGSNNFYAERMVLERVVYHASYGQSYPQIAMLGISITADQQFSGGTPQIQVPVSGHRVRVWDAGEVVEGEDDSTGLSEECYTFANLVGTAFEGIWTIVPPGRNPAWQALYLHTADEALSAQGLEPDYQAFRNWADYCDEQGITAAYVFDRGGSKGLDELAKSVYAAGRAVIVQAGRKIVPLYWFRDAHGRDANVVPAKEVMAIVAARNCEQYTLTYLPVHERPNRLTAQIRDEGQSFDLVPVSMQDETINWTDPGALDYTPIIESERDYSAITDDEQCRDLLYWELEWSRLSDREVQATCPIEMAYMSVGDLFLFQADKYPVQVDADELASANVSARVVGDLDGGTDLVLDQDVVIESDVYSCAIQTPNAVTVVLLDLTDGPGTLTYAAGDPLPLYGVATLPDPCPSGSVVTIGQAVAGTPDAGSPPPAGETYICTGWDLRSDGRVVVTGRKWAPEAWEPRAEGTDYEDPTRPDEDATIPGTETGTASTVAGEQVAARRLADGSYELVWSMPAGYHGTRARVDVVGSGGYRRTIGATRDARLSTTALDPRGVSVTVAPYADRAGLVVPSSVLSAVHVPEFRAEPVQAVEGLRAVVDADGVLLAWSGVDGAELYEVRRGTYWDGAEVVASTTERRCRIAEVPKGERTYHVKARRAWSGVSGRAASATVTWDVPGDAVNLAHLDVAAASASTIGTGLATSGTLVEIATGYHSGTFEDELDIGAEVSAAWTCEVDHHEEMLRMPSWLERVPVDAGEGNWWGQLTREPTVRHPGWDLEDETDIATVSWDSARNRGAGRNTIAIVQARWSSDGATWTDWERFFPQRRRARYMQARCRLRRGSLSYQIRAERLRMQATT